jgi:hypothetical protein
MRQNADRAVRTNARSGGSGAVNSAECERARAHACEDGGAHRCTIMTMGEEGGESHGLCRRVAGCERASRSRGKYLEAFFISV